ncbi:MAG: FAD-dependent oxidoreductase [Verrucomicrobia bacterium]|nr:FAD-dependent oxidoreductase [Verrucomicrobiota bacterium]
MSDSSHVVILGAGIIGLCSALYCVRRGMPVTVIDRQAEDRDGCSFGNAGMVVPSHFVPLAAPGMVALGFRWMWNPESPFYIKPRLDPELFAWGWRFIRASTAGRVRAAAPLLRDLNLASRSEYERLASELPDEFGLVQRGLLMLCRTEHGLEEEAAFAAKAEALGVPARVLGVKETAAMDPTVTMDVAGSVFFPKDCHLSPHRFMKAVLEECGRLGVRFLWGSEVTGVRRERDRVRSLETTAGEIPVGRLVLAGGSWSSRLGAGLGLSIPMQAGKGYSLTLDRPRQLPELCSILTEARVAVTPMGGSLRFGGTMEIAGLNENITERRVRGIVKAAVRYFPAYEPGDFEGIRPWRGLRPCSPDGLPYLGRSRRVANLVVATGHAMMGLSLGPITGRLVVELLAGDRPSFNLDLVSPDRYG